MKMHDIGTEDKALIAFHLRPQNCKKIQKHIMKAVLKVNQIMLLEMSKNKSQPAYKNSLQNFVAIS